jgi:hypothetical protein
MSEMAEDYFQKARMFAAMAAVAHDPSVAKTYTTLAADYVRLGRYAVQHTVDTVLTQPSQQCELTGAPT